MDEGLRLVIADFGLATTEPTCNEWGCGSSFYMSPGTACSLHLVHCLLSNRMPRAGQACQILRFSAQRCMGLRGRYLFFSCVQHTYIHQVILINLTTGRNPWRYATPKDQTFKAFMDDPDSLRSILPLSRAANDLLKRCFALDPRQRISAAELRREVLAVDRFIMSKSELLRSPSAVRAAAKAAWGEMEKARAKRTTPFVPVPFPYFPYDSETELVRPSRPQLIINVRQPSDASHDSAAGPSMSSTRGIFQRNSDSLTVFDDNSRRPSLFSGSSDDSGSDLHTPQFSPHRSLEDVPGFNLDSAVSDPKANGQISLSPRRGKVQPTPEKDPKPPSSPILSMGRFFKRIKL
jgi:serine/threonine protein kinase